eukprot:scaffold122524_cov14-Prasinocladus_malaysianus.AAC.1
MSSLLESALVAMRTRYTLAHGSSLLALAQVRNPVREVRVRDHCIRARQDDEAIRRPPGYAAVWVQTRVYGIYGLRFIIQLS